MSDSVFGSSLPKAYDTYLVPLIFEPYAADMVSRLETFAPSTVLEVACGTGVLTRAMAASLSRSTQIVSTDLNQPMLDYASMFPNAGDIEWRQADAMALPFGDGAFDAVVCQFGVMFCSDKPRAFSEACRVLRTGGVFIFNVWDRIEENELADTVTNALATVFPDDPPRFMARTPHGYHDRDVIARDLERSAFSNQPRIETVTARSRAASPRVPAVAYCEGTPLRDEIESRDASRLGEAVDASEEAIAARFGRGAIDAKIQAHVVTIES
ncbi:MAG TPA: class I SAM-dependent methyltransferase [Gemmatimonadaceae bacterium]